MSGSVEHVALARSLPGVVLALLLVSGTARFASAQDAFRPTSSFGPFIQQGQLPATGQTALSGDAALVASGGVVYVFERDPVTETWTEVAQLTASDGALNFGRAIAIDRSTIIVGAQGAAYVFRRRARGAPVWREVARFVPSDGNQSFGEAVDVDRNHAIVGAPGSPTYVFRRNDGSQEWSEVARVEGAGFFGYGVGISGDAAIVGGSIGMRAVAYIFGRDQGGPENWGLLKQQGPFFEGGANVAIDGDVAMFSTNDPGFFGAYIHIFRRDSGGPNAWGPEPMYGNPDRGSLSGLSLSGDRVADIVGGEQVRVSARNQGHLNAPPWDPIIGGPNAWGQVSRLIPRGPRFTSTSISGDTVLVATVSGHVEVLVSDVDGDGIRDGRDPCVLDPLNNVAGGCQRASLAYPVLDDLIAQDAVTTETEGRRFIITATFTNTSQTAVRNPFFEVIALTAPNVVVNADAGRGGIGSTFSLDVGDGLLSLGESVAAQFIIRLRSQQPFEFRVNFRGEPVS